MVTQIRNKIQHFLMFDTYQTLNYEDKEFLGALMLVVRLCTCNNLLSFCWILIKTSTKKKLAFDL